MVEEILDCACKLPELRRVSSGVFGSVVGFGIRFDGIDGVDASVGCLGMSVSERKLERQLVENGSTVVGECFTGE